MTEATLVQHTFPETLYRIPGGILVLIPEAWEFVSDTEQQLLARILGSVKLSLAGIQILHVTRFSVEEAAVYRAKTILSFGVPIAGQTKLYEAASDASVTIVLADRLGSLDDARKKNLWGALKQAFRVS